MAAKSTRLTRKIAIQLHLIADRCTICNSRSRRPVRKLLGTPSYVYLFIYSLTPWYRKFLEKVIVTQLVKQYLAFFMEPILSQLNPVRPIDLHLPKVHLTIILSPTPRSSQWSLPFGPSNRNPVNTSPLSRAFQMSRPPHPPWFNHPNIVRWRIQAMKFIIVLHREAEFWGLFRRKLESHLLFQSCPFVRKFTALQLPDRFWSNMICCTYTKCRIILILI
jgi:hypothetical protein